MMISQVAKSESHAHSFRVQFSLLIKATLVPPWSTPSDINLLLDFVKKNSHFAFIENSQEYVKIFIMFLKP